MSATLAARDIFVRYTEGRAVRHVCHRVWDADRFMAARRAECDQYNAELRDKRKPGDPEPIGHRVEQITEETYRAATRRA